MCIVYATKREREIEREREKEREKLRSGLLSLSLRMRLKVHKLVHLYRGTFVEGHVIWEGCGAHIVSVRRCSEARVWKVYNM